MICDLDVKCQTLLDTFFIPKHSGTTVLFFFLELYISISRSSSMKNTSNKEENLLYRIMMKLPWTIKKIEPGLRAK
jgi:hypothetical protein